MIVAETDELAREKYEEYLSYSDLEGSAALFGGWTGQDLPKFSEDEDFRFASSPAVRSMVAAFSTGVPGNENVKWTRRRLLQELAVSGFNAKIIGSPKTVADELQRWIDVGGIDGFNLSYAVSPGTFEGLVEFLWPELRSSVF